MIMILTYRLLPCRDIHDRDGDDCDVDDYVSDDCDDDDDDCNDDCDDYDDDDDYGDDGDYGSEFQRSAMKKENDGETPVVKNSQSKF